ncbi:hypothetical protein [Streptomyces griseocarneus]|uniref:hypothetical protein n=1 Tax=Streptomyces griseocarneus TaxID=51201 RepID=UPI00167E4175|nr:hypothetical protein [Streptomyces griseocarneus]MBZ6477507.1 hypothetical protein [Streptomyces griseocarneus]GHG82789.1 hypothetical protein GCM10018779_65720 [Streptomyces griseocarneus]
MTSWLPDVSGAVGAWSWVLPLVIAVLALALTVWGVGRLRRSVWLSGIGPQAVVALGGVAVSVHGLWGFATDTCALPTALASAFIAVFDAAEMTLLVMMYRAADPEAGWTRELRLMHRTAWTLVGFSAAMNAVHAPNWWARPVLAAVPALAAWLIELQLRSKLHHTRPEEEETARPGPVRLVALLWQHGWAALFAVLGLDARSSSSAIARAALAQRAALRIYRLRLALEAGKSARVRRLRGKAQKALDRADVATETGQALALVRRLGALTRAEEVARLDYRDTTAVLTLIEDLAVTPAVQRQEASALAAQAESARREAETARQEAEDARQRAEDARKEAETARKRAEDALAAARQELEAAQSEHAALLARGENAAGQEETARQRAAEAEHRAESARQEEAAARQRAEQILKDAAHHAAQQAAEQQERVDTLTAQLQDLGTQYQARAALLAQVNGQIEEAALLRDRLHGDLAALHPHAPDAALSGAGPVWKSEAKQEGWAFYLHRLTTDGHDEPTAAELSDRFRVDPGNARNWLRDFRAARAAQLAAHQPRALAAVNGHDLAGAL